MESHNLENPHKNPSILHNSLCAFLSLPRTFSAGHVSFFSPTQARVIPSHLLSPARDCLDGGKGKNSHVYMESQLRKFTYFDRIENE